MFARKAKVVFCIAKTIWRVRYLRKVRPAGAGDFWCVRQTNGTTGAML